MGCSGSTESAARSAENIVQSLSERQEYSWRSNARLGKKELSSIASIYDPQSTMTVETVNDWDKSDFGENKTASRKGEVRRIMLPPDHWVEVKPVRQGSQSLVQLCLIQEGKVTSPIEGKVWKFTLSNLDSYPDVDPYAFARLIHWMIMRAAGLSPEGMISYLDDLASECSKNGGRVDWAALVEEYKK